jgi:hypothetical protein
VFVCLHGHIWGWTLKSSMTGWIWKVLLSYTSCFLPNILDLTNCIACYSCIWLHHGSELQVLSSKFRDVLQATSKLSSLVDLYELIASCQHKLTSSTEWFLLWAVCKPSAWAWVNSNDYFKYYLTILDVHTINLLSEKFH